MDDFNVIPMAEGAASAPAKFIAELGLDIGMYSTIGSMSLWELAHRWVEADPMTPEGTAIPLAVQAPLRALSRAAASRKIGASHVVLYHDDEADPEAPIYNPSFDTYPDEPLSQEDVLGLISCTPDRKLLDSIYVQLTDVFHWVVRQEFSFPFPDFLVPPWAWKPEPKNESGRDDAQRKEAIPRRRPQEEMLDKAMCQGAAIALWDVYPEMRINHVCAHPGYLRAGASKYAETTRRAWAVEVAPNHIKGRSGRSKKATDSQQENPPPVTEN